LRRGTVATNVPPNQRFPEAWMIVRRALALAILGSALPSDARAQSTRQVREPLPFEVALAFRSHNARSSVDLSPDGRWVAHTVQSKDNVPRDTLSRAFAASGFPFAEGDSRMEATLTHTRTGEMIRLGGANSSSWGPVWSPDGRRVAFYSDEGGEAGVWVWELATRSATRFPGVIARPFFGFELLCWTSDGQRLVAKVLPNGMTIAQANALGRTVAKPASRFPQVAPGEPSVNVRRFDPKETRAAPTRTTTEKTPPIGDVKWGMADLAVLDLTTRTVTRLVERTVVRAFALSPDDRMVAYTVLKGWEANTQQSNLDLVVRELASGATRTVATDVRLGYGIEWTWSPDSRTLAYIASGQLGTGEVVIVPSAGGPERKIKPDSAPNFGVGEGEYPPLWSADGKHVFAIGDGKLWRMNVASGRGAAVGALDGWHVRSTVTPFGRPVIWSHDRGRTVWVVARNRDNTKAGIQAIDLVTGRARVALEEPKSYLPIFNVDANESTGEIAFVSTDQQHLHDVWLFDTQDGTTRRASHLNDTLDRYELGTARILDWKTAEGKALRGALLLPPGHQSGTRVPLVVYVYGGDNGSRFINRFGFSGDLPTFNMHLLATRGFAVLYPDAPLEQGKTMTDIVRTVMPGVDAAIAQGYADPDRLAVMGQSYGSFNTLSIITQTNRFKAAVITAAVVHPDLVADYLQSMGYYEHGQGNMGGTIWEQRDRYIQNSPLFHFDKIETPLLIGQGEKDGDLEPSEAIYVALERLGKPVEYRVYQGEGHVITQAPHVLDFWKRRLEFLAEHLDLTYDAKGAVVFEGGRAKSRRPGA
jgi:dipeptidyl aminopeptidase/acylaminoacyl peptidase